MAEPQEVETALVGEVAPGDVVLVHAGVALTRLDRAAPAQDREEAAA
jgi:hydrogenase maturation factor